MRIFVLFVISFTLLHESLYYMLLNIINIAHFSPLVYNLHLLHSDKV